MVALLPPLALLNEERLANIVAPNVLRRSPVEHESEWQEGGASDDEDERICQMTASCAFLQHHLHCSRVPAVDGRQSSVCAQVQTMKLQEENN